jgi:hypothetical protein
MTTVTRSAHLPAQPAARHQDQPLAVLEVPLAVGYLRRRILGCGVGPVEAIVLGAAGS